MTLQDASRNCLARYPPTVVGGAFEGIGPLPAGTYTFSTTIESNLQLVSSSELKAHTTVMVREASAPAPPIQ
jgi:hypothetical protein